MNSDEATYVPYFYEQGFIDITGTQATFADLSSSPVVFLGKSLTSDNLVAEVK